MHPRSGTAEDAVDLPVRAGHVALPFVTRDVDPRLGSRGARVEGRQREAGALLGRQELGDQSRLCRVDRELRTARRREADEVEPLQDTVVTRALLDTLGYRD